MTQPPNHHEFSASENATISDAIKPMSLAAIAWPILGVAGLASAWTTQDPWAIISALLFIALGASLLMTTRSLKGVITTEGDDIKHMMSALRSTTQYFLILCAVCAILAVLTLSDVLSLLR